MDDSASRGLRTRLILLLVFVVGLLAVSGFFVARRVLQEGAFGCCGPAVAYGELWYCREPDALHPVGDVYLLTTSPVEKQVGQLREWPDRLETGHVGTPLRWMQPAGAASLALNLDPAGPNDSTVDERTSATVVEGQLTSVLVAASDVTPAACPVAPTEMSTPTP